MEDQIYKEQSDYIKQIKEKREAYEKAKIDAVENTLSRLSKDKVPYFREKAEKDDIFGANYT